MSKRTRKHDQSKGESVMRPTPIDSNGEVIVPADFCKEAGLKLNSEVWIIDDEGLAIVITNNCSGYKDCDMEKCLLDKSGIIKLPSKYLNRLEISDKQEVAILLPHTCDEVVIETFKAASC